MTATVLTFPIIPRPIPALPQGNVPRETFGKRQPQALSFCWLVVSLTNGDTLAIPHVLGHMSATFKTMRQTVMTLSDVRQVETQYTRPNASAVPVSIGPYVGFRVY